MTKPPNRPARPVARALVAILSLVSFATLAAPFARAAAAGATAAGPATATAAVAVPPASLRLASPFSDHLVLQRGRPVRVWGDAPAGATVDVSLGGTDGAKPVDRATATAEPDGRWSASLPARPATAEPLTLRASIAKDADRGEAEPAGEIVVNDVLVGDVWVCAGQSNMQMPLAETVGGPAEAERAAGHPTLRLLTIPKRPSAQPQATWDAKPANARWQVDSPKAAAAFPAVGYYFAVELKRSGAVAGDVPLGLIDCSLGGTAAEA